jgi:hypothetical protein
MCRHREGMVELSNRRHVVQQLHSRRAMVVSAWSSVRRGGVSLQDLREAAVFASCLI